MNSALPPYNKMENGGKMNKTTFEEIKSFVEGKEGNGCKLLTKKRRV